MEKPANDKQYWDKPSPPFVELMGDLPYDMVWYRGKRWYAGLSYGPEAAPVEENSLRICQSDQSGFLIETPTASLLFDWYRRILPPIRRDKPLHVFISHIHSDHFNQALLNLAKRFPDVSIYLGYDYSDEGLNEALEKLPEACADSVSCFRGGQHLDIAGGTVHALESTDLGVAFLVELDGLRFFHGGDLFPWRGAETDFLAYIAALKGVRIDYAMLPMDPRFPEAAGLSISAYLSQAEISCFTPMHLWNRPEYTEEFFAQNPRLRAGMCCVLPGQPPQTFLLAGRKAQLRSAAYKA